MDGYFTVYQDRVGANPVGTTYFNIAVTGRPLHRFAL